MTLTDAQWDQAIKSARDIGAEHGLAAASWIDIDERSAATILQGIEDGDPAVYDALPYPDLSGEWAGNFDARDLLYHVAPDGIALDLDDPGDIFDAYDDGFYTACHPEIERRCRYHLED